MKMRDRLALQVIVMLHALIICLNVTAFIALPLEQPWYVWVPLCTIIARIVWGAGECPLTVLENKIRKKIGMKPIKGFVYHYFWPHFFK